MMYKCFILYVALCNILTHGFVLLFGRWATVPLKNDTTRYINAKEKYRLTYPKNEESFGGKRRACTAIMASEHMRDHYNVEPVDIHEEGDFEEIRDEYRKIYDRSFKKLSPFQHQYELENPYRLRDVWVGNETQVHPRDYDRNAIYGFPEFVFSCLAKHRESGKLVEFFLSQEYPIAANETPTRFIFALEDEKEAKKIIPIGEACMIETPRPHDFDATYRPTDHEWL